MVEVDHWKMFCISVGDWKQTEEGACEKSTNQFLESNSIIYYRNHTRKGEKKNGAPIMNEF